MKQAKKETNSRRKMIRLAVQAILLWLIKIWSHNFKLLASISFLLRYKPAMIKRIFFDNIKREEKCPARDATFDRTFVHSQ